MHVFKVAILIFYIKEDSDEISISCPEQRNISLFQIHPRNIHFIFGIICLIFSILESIVLKVFFCNIYVILYQYLSC